MHYIKTLKHLWFDYQDEDDMSDEEKLSSGKYVLVRGDILKIRSITTLIALLTLVLVIARKWDLTFDSQQQKQQIITHVQTISPIDVMLQKQKQEDILNEVKDLKGLIKEMKAQQ